MRLSGDPSRRERARRPATMGRAESANVKKPPARRRSSEMYRLIRAEVEKQRRQQTVARKGDRRPARLPAEEHQQAAAEFGQNDQRQQPPVNSVGLHIVGDAGVARDLPDALDNENVSQHRPGKQPSGPAPRYRKLRFASKVSACRRGAGSARYADDAIFGFESETDARRFLDACVKGWRRLR